MTLAIPANIRVLLDWGTSEAGVILMGAHRNNVNCSFFHDILISH